MGTQIVVNGGAIVVGLLLALIPATIASRKGQPFALWYLFGLFCFLPALVISLVISEAHLTPRSYAEWSAQQGGFAPPVAPPVATPPAGWYADPGGTASQRYWDGARWTDHLN